MILGDHFTEAVINSRSLRHLNFFRMAVESELARQAIEASKFETFYADFSVYSVKTPMEFFDFIDNDDQ